MKPARKLDDPRPINSNTDARKDICAEKHYSVSGLASSWQLSENTIRRMFENEPGVLKWGTTEGGFKRRYITMRDSGDGGPTRPSPTEGSGIDELLS